MPLVYSTDGNIALIAVDGSAKQALTKVPAGGQARDPAWSPDGKRIAYAYSPPLPAVRGPGGLIPLPVTGIYVMDAGGSDQKVLIPHETPGIGHETPIWAPDGKSLYVTYTEFVMESNIVKDQVFEVARVVPGDNKRQTLIPNAAFPAVSPDGKQVACIVSQRNGQALVVANTDGSNVRTILPAGTIDGISSPQFSPDGKQIVYSAAAPMAPLPIPTFPPGRQPAPGPEAVPPPPTPARSASNGTGLLGLATGTAALLGRVLQPRTASAHGLPADLFVVDAAGGTPRRLTQLGEDSPTATWSPDGKAIVMLAGGGIYTLKANGDDLKSIDDSGGHGSIDWKPA